MLDEIIGFIFSIGIFIMCNIICRMSSSYLPKSKCKKYIVIKNRMIARILISDGISRDKFVRHFDLNKMSIVGLISYIVIEPINLYILIISIMDNFRLGNMEILGITYGTAYEMLGILEFLFLIIFTINTKDCDKYRPY